MKDLNEINAVKFARMHEKNLENLRYRKRQAIEYAREKLGMSWDDNRQRLSFYEHFEEYLRNHGEVAGNITNHRGLIWTRS